MIDEGYKVFSYNFATPNQVETKFVDDGKYPAGYSTIFNVINYDDLVPYLPLTYWGFEKYGCDISYKSLSSYQRNEWNAKGIHSAKLDLDITTVWGGATYDDSPFFLPNTINSFSQISEDRNGCYETYYKFECRIMIDKEFKELLDAIPYFKNYYKEFTFIDGANYTYQSPIFFMQILAATAAGDKTQNRLVFY